MSEGQQAYLIYIGSSPAALATEIAVAGDDFTQWTVDNGGTIVANYALTGADVDPENATFLANYSNPDSKGGVNGYYQVVIFDPDGQKFTVADAGQVTGVSDSTGTGDVRINADWSEDVWIGSSGYTGSVTAAPEPTSAMLLLLGMAGLALRRRRA